MVTSKTFRHWAQVLYYPDAIYVVMTLGLALPTLAFFVRRHRMLARAAQGRDAAGKKSAGALALLDLLSFLLPGRSMKTCFRQTYRHQTRCSAASCPTPMP